MCQSGETPIRVFCDIDIEFGGHGLTVLETTRWIREFYLGLDHLQKRIRPT